MHRPEVAEIFRRFGPAYLRSHVMSPEQGRALCHIIDCRTAVLGGHEDVCLQCGKSWRGFNSCRDRHCPSCQGLQQLRWIKRRLERVVPTHHFHVVFTLPEPLRSIALANRKRVYDMIFSAASETLLELAETRWGALPGITAVLHTWTRQMIYHPHLHCIVTGGGLAETDDGGCWVAAKPNYLFPVHLLGALFRGKFLHQLRTAWKAGSLRFVGSSAHLAKRAAFAAMIDGLYETSWIVYAKRPFGGPQQVIRYLGRYTHRIAISSSRLVSIGNDAIVFKTHGDKTCRVRPNEFLRRFLLHILPKGFRKIRHYGLLASSNVPTRLRTAQDIVGGMNRRNRRDSPLALPPLPPQNRHCPACKVGRLIRMPIRPRARAPPGATP